MFNFFKKSKNQSMMKNKLKLFPLFLVGIWFLNLILNLTIGNYVLAGMNLVCVILFSIGAWTQSADWREEKQQLKIKAAKKEIENKKREDAQKLIDRTNFDFWKEKESEKNLK